MQTQEYSIEIKNEKIRNYHIITLLVVILNVLFFAYSLFNNSQRKSALISLAFIVIYTAYRFYKAKKANNVFFFDEWIYFLLMLLWVDNYLAAFMCIILFLSYTISLQKITYNFDRSVIKQKNFPWKKTQWDEISNVVLRDNVLTIDFKSNKIIQGEIANPIKEEDFNNFVKKQVGGLMTSV